MKKRTLNLILVCISVLTSCRGVNEPTPIRAPGLTAPVATGIIITDETGPDPIGVLGNPSSNGYWEDPDYAPEPGTIAPAKFALSTPYPNPANGSMNIGFEIPKTCPVLLYVVPAHYIDQDHQIIQFSNGTINIPEGNAIEVLFNQYANAGLYRVNWSGRDETGRPFPDGFYRIYMKIDDHFLWQDVLLVFDSSNLPPGFPSIGDFLEGG